MSTTAYVLPGFTCSIRADILIARKLFYCRATSVVKATVGACKGCKGRITDPMPKPSSTVLLVTSALVMVWEKHRLRRRSISPLTQIRNAAVFHAKRWRYDMWPGSPAEGYVLQPG